MLESLTEGAMRVLEQAQVHARRRGGAHVEPIDLLSALIDDAESRAAVLLAEHGLDAGAFVAASGAAGAAPAADPGGEALSQSPDLRAALGHAALQAKALDRGRSVGTEHLLAGLLATPGEAAERLAAAGLELERLRDQLRRADTAETTPIPLAVDIPPPVLSEPGEAADLGRILDAAANRAREGLRVVEDYVRFVLDDPMLTRRLKDVRHRLAGALGGLDPELLLTARDTPGDVGTHIMTATERARESPRALLTANFKRTAEALRCLEEYTKLFDEWLSGRFEVLRYDVYTLEKLTLTALRAHWSLAEARLYVLVGGLPTLGDLTWVVGEALAGGADVIQLREKGPADREVLRRAREVRILTARARARFVLNDRPDLARLSGADGVHLGQDDVSVRDARRIVGPNALIGVSTHDPAQLEAAILGGANYLGVGPVFPSATKDFAEWAGLALVRRAAEATTLPWFAIGGIAAENLDAVLEAGATRVAVAAAVVRAERPRAAAAALRARLEGNGAADGRG
jgi:thiamine-phosphate pyrophosphorylase